MKDILPEIFHWNDPESLFPFTFQLDFDETFCKWETTEERKQSRDYFDLDVVPCNCHLQHSVYIQVWRSRYACINFFICFSTKTSRKLAIIVPHQGYQATFISKGNAVQFRLKKVKRSLPFCCTVGLFWKSYLFDSRWQLRRTLGPISPPKQSYCEIRHTPTQSLAKQRPNYHLQYAHIEIRLFC